MTRLAQRRALIVFGAIIAPLALAVLVYTTPWKARAQPAIAVQTVNGATNIMTAYTQTVATVTGGTFTGSWSPAFPVAPSVVLVPIVTGSSAIQCELTALPTASAFQGRCWTASAPTTLNLSIVTAGLSLSPNAASASGISVLVIGMSPSQ